MSESSKRRPLSPISLACGALSFGLLIGQAYVAKEVLPKLGAWLRTDPRLAMIGIFGLVVFPGLVVAFAHHVGHRFLDSVDRTTGRRPAFPKLESWWAGALAWMVIYGASMLARLAFFIIHPPAPRDGLSFGMLVEDAIEQQAHIASAYSLYALLWIGIASALYELERQTRR